MTLVKTFHLTDFESYQNNNFKLNDKVLDTIFFLSNLFPNKNQEKKKNKKRQVEFDPNFKKTVIVKAEGTKLLLSEIGKCINKITTDNYISQRDAIFLFLEEFKSICKKDEIDEFVFSIINMITNSCFNIDLNASLFCELINNFDIFQNRIEYIIEKYNNLLDNIKIVDASENYDEFCNNNHCNTIRKSTGIFLVSLLKKRVIPKEFIIEKIIEIQDKLFECTNIQNKKSEIDELSENIYGLIVNSRSELYKENSWKNIINNVDYVTKLVVKEQVSFTSRSKFKHMDILSECKKLSLL